MIAGKIIHIGDGMVCYSPETSNHDKKSAFRNVINCEIAMMADIRFINIGRYEMELPDVSYRISADYGIFRIAKSLTSEL